MSGVTIYLRSGEKSFQTSSDAIGHYEFSGVAPGKYTLSTNLPDFLTDGRQTVSVADKGCLKVALSVQATGEVKGRL